MNHSQRDAGARCSYHVFPPEFGSLTCGNRRVGNLPLPHRRDFRSTDLTHATFWRMTKAERADFVWQTLFVENTPLSEAARGIVTVLTAFDLDPRAPNLNEARAFFKAQKPREHLDRVLDMACVSEVVMTNDPFSEQEAQVWQSGSVNNGRLRASLRLDGLLNDWEAAGQTLRQQGFQVDAEIGGQTTTEVRRFLDKWILLMRPVYLAVSLPAEFKYPDTDQRDRLLREVILPTAREHGLAITLMIGVRRGVNPALRSAGDAAGKADVTVVERLCADNPDLRFLATFLSRENQHDLCVIARKFNNLMPFGCWWFLNNPSIVSEITHERLELLGPSFVPQHSDARVLAADQSGNIARNHCRHPI